MSRTGRHRGGALRAWRDARGDVRDLPAIPLGAHKFENGMRAHPPPGLAPIALDRAPEPRIESAEI
eukprot:5478963-Prymnesium_polylepis.1